MRVPSAVALAGLLLLLAACSRPAAAPPATASVPDRAPEIRGVITQLTARDVAQAAHSGETRPGGAREDEVGAALIES